MVPDVLAAGRVVICNAREKKNPKRELSSAQILWPRAALFVSLLMFRAMRV